MNFDGSLDISGTLSCWSPNGRYLAVVASKARLVVRDSKNLEVVFSEVCSSVSAFGGTPTSPTRSSSTLTSGVGDGDAKIDKIGFSPDSVFVFASSFRAGVTHVFQVRCCFLPL